MSFWLGLVEFEACSSIFPFQFLGKVSVSHLVTSASLWPHGLLPVRLLCPWDSPVKNTRVGCHSLFQGIFSTQGSNPGLLHGKHFLYHLNHQESQFLGISHKSETWNDLHWWYLSPLSPTANERPSEWPLLVMESLVILRPGTRVQMQKRR